MRSGELRHKVQLQKLGGRVDDGYGGGSESMSDIATVYASIEPLTGSEILRAGQLDSNITHRIRIRYYPGVTPRWQVKYGTRQFDINSVADIEERHIQMELMCTELIT